MNRSTLFTLAIIATAILAIIGIVYLIGGTPLGHHIKHALLFFGLAVIALLFALVNRPRAGLRV